jgi:hypothetical protein
MSSRATPVGLSEILSTNRGESGGTLPTARFSFILTHRLIRLWRRRVAAPPEQHCRDGQAVAGDDPPPETFLRNKLELAGFYIDAPDSLPPIC